MRSLLLSVCERQRERERERERGERKNMKIGHLIHCYMQLHTLSAETETGFASFFNLTSYPGVLGGGGTPRYEAK